MSKTIKLDYSLVKTEDELKSWIINEMSITPTELELDSRFIFAVFKALAKRGLNGGAFEVEELNTDMASSEILSLLNGAEGWRQALGFHLSREGTGASVRFL